MIQQQLYEWITHPERLNRDTLYELRTLLARYPYFQTVRLLYLKNLFLLHDITFGEELRKAAQFILDYNPDLQFKLVRCNATHSELALNDSIPSLGLLSSTYGDETPIEWLKIQFGSLNDFAEVSTKIAKEQLSELSEIFLSEYYYINAAEICFFIARFKSGKYGRFYGSIDPLKITSAMLDYVSERRKDIERKERERYRNQREKEIEERGDNRISYAEYIEIKHRADAGDEEARKMLISP